MSSNVCCNCCTKSGYHLLCPQHLLYAGFKLGSMCPQCVWAIGHKGLCVEAFTCLAMECHCGLDVFQPTELQPGSYTSMVAQLNLERWKTDILNHCLRYYCLQQTVWILPPTEAAKYGNSEVFIKLDHYLIILDLWISWERSSENELLINRQSGRQSLR